MGSWAVGSVGGILRGKPGIPKIKKQFALDAKLSVGYI